MSVFSQLKEITNKLSIYDANDIKIFSDKYIKMPLFSRLRCSNRN